MGLKQKKPAIQLTAHLIASLKLAAGTLRPIRAPLQMLDSSCHCIACVCSGRAARAWQFEGFSSPSYLCIQVSVQGNQFTDDMFVCSNKQHFLSAENLIMQFRLVIIALRLFSAPLMPPSSSRMAQGKSMNCSSPITWQP
jgi:hypothetical protein